MDETRADTAPRLSFTPGRGRDGSSSTARGRGRRFTELVRIARRHNLLPWRNMDFGFDPASTSRRAIQANELRLALEEAGGGFVKAGQLLSTRTDILPPEFVASLSLLQQSVTPAPWNEVEVMLEVELGGPIASVFREFDEVPIAAASIAQVHRATLLSGEVVAVKIQRPGVAPLVRRDIDIVLRFIRFLTVASPQARQMDVASVVVQYAEDLRRQLDFRLESQSLGAMRTLQSRSRRADEVVLPRLYESITTNRVMVMEFLEGETLAARNASTAARSPELGEAMRTVLRAFLRQISFDGVYHSDLHPGNIMILTDGRPALVDFGSVGRLDSVVRETVQDLLIAYLQSDMERIADGLLTLATLKEGASEREFRRDISTFVTYELGPGARVSVATVDVLVDVFTKYGMSAPPEFVAAARGFAILEGTLRATLPEFDLLEQSRDLAGEQLRDQLTVRNIRDLFMGEVLAMMPGIRKLPRRLDRISESIEKGTLNVNIRLLADKRDRRLLTGLVRETFLMIGGISSGIFALVYLTQTPPAHQGVLTPEATGIILAIVAGIFFIGAALDRLTSHRK